MLEARRREAQKREELKGRFATVGNYYWRGRQPRSRGQIQAGGEGEEEEQQDENDDGGGSGGGLVRSRGAHYCTS